jgi:hypothetical protein
VHPIRLVAILFATLLLPLAVVPDGSALGSDVFVVGVQGALPDVGSTWHGGKVLATDEALAQAVVKAPRGFAPPARFVEGNPRMPMLQLVPDDSYWAAQTGLQSLRMPEAWDVTTTGGAICVIDTGVRYSHEDLASAWRGGANTIDGVDAWDGHGHGTHVAGIATATINNGLGIAGTAHLDLYAVRALDDGGYGTFASIAAAIAWCADHTPERTVISMSLGTSTFSRAIEEAVAYAAASGRMLVAAAGNDGCSDCVSYPARHHQVMAVGCVDARGRLCSFSSQGPEVDVVAPGKDIISTWATADDAYAVLSGTSMSTPFAAALAAWLWNQFPTATAGEIRQRIQNSAADLGAPGRDDAHGWGRIDAVCAYAGTACGAITVPTFVVDACALAGPTAGYVCQVGPAQWEDLGMAGRVLRLGDDEVVAQPLPFAFNFFGRPYRSMHISSNGFVAFTQPPHSGCCSGQVLPDSFAPNNLIAAYWTDLDPSSGGEIRVANLGVAPARRTVLQFSEVPHYGTTNGVSFQLVLHEQGRIEVHFDLVTAPDGSHVTGIEDATGLQALMHAWGEHDPSGQAITFWRPRADLQVTALAAPRIHVGDQAALQWRLRNAGPDEAPAMFTIALPPGLDLGDAPGCSLTGRSVACPVALAANESVVLGFNVTGLRAGTFLVRATATAAVTDPVMANNGATLRVPVAARSADLSVRLDAAPGPYVGGGTVQVVARVDNAGPHAATPRIVVALPPGSTGPPECTSSASTWRCTLPELAAGENATVEFDMALRTGTMRPRATVSSPLVDPRPAGNSFTLALLVERPRAALVLERDPVVPGSPVELRVRNDGPQEAQNVVLTDTISPLLLVCPGPENCTPCTGTTQVTCRLGTIAAGETRVVRYEFQGSSGTLRGRVTSSTYDANMADNAASVAVSAAPMPP